MRIPTGSIVTACVLSAVLLLAGCADTAVKKAQPGEVVFLQPAAGQGPDPFTDSAATGVTATGRARPTGPQGTADAGAPPAGPPVAPLAAAQTLSGETPGLYGGSARVAGCDVERQIARLTADPARGDAFAGVAGVSRSALPGYLRALTPVLLRADTRVTNYAYRNGRAVGYQAVLQAGTAVLVDDRGMPRVRCACGNPLRSPEEARGGGRSRGTVWSGYRPNQVIVVTPAPKAVSSLELVDATTNTWIERRIGADVRKDHVVPPPAQSATSAPPAPAFTGPTWLPPPGIGRPSAPASRPGGAPGETGRGSPDATPPAPDRTATGCASTASSPQSSGPVGCPADSSAAGHRTAFANSTMSCASTASPQSSGPAGCGADSSAAGHGTASAAGHRTAFANSITAYAEQGTPAPGDTALPPGVAPSPVSPGDTGPPSVASTAEPRGADGPAPDGTPGSAGGTDPVPDSPAGVLDG